METPAITVCPLASSPAVRVIVCNMVFEKSQGTSIVQLEMEGPRQIVDQVMELLSVTN